MNEGSGALGFWSHCTADSGAPAMCSCELAAARQRRGGTRNAEPQGRKVRQGGFGVAFATLIYSTVSL